MGKKHTPQKKDFYDDISKWIEHAKEQNKLLEKIVKSLSKKSKENATEDQSKINNNLIVK